MCYVWVNLGVLGGCSSGSVWVWACCSAWAAVPCTWFDQEWGCCRRRACAAGAGGAPSRPEGRPSPGGGQRQALRELPGSECLCSLRAESGGLQRFSLAVHCGGCMVDHQKMR